VTYPEVWKTRPDQREFSLGRKEGKTHEMKGKKYKPENFFHHDIEILGALQRNPLVANVAQALLDLLALFDTSARARSDAGLKRWGERCVVAGADA